MPANKNAMTRYAMLDLLLSDYRHNRSIQDMTDYLAAHLPEYGLEPVTKRQVEKDIRYLEYDSPFGVELERYKIDAPTNDGEGVRKKQCIRYADKTFSIFRKALSKDERILLSSVLSILGSFKGQPNFEWLETLAKKLKLDVKEQRTIISRSPNISENPILIVELYKAISDKAVINLHYHSFSRKETRTYELSPYLLKEYNTRWYLMGYSFDRDKILTFALDRIDGWNYNSDKTYKLPPEDLLERFEDIIGITYYEDRPVERILFWVAAKSNDYVATQPLHGSQRHLSESEQKRLTDLYPQLPSGGVFYTIDCKENYELIRALSSYGSELIVLYPPAISEKIMQNTSDTLSRYQTIFDAPRP